MRHLEGIAAFIARDSPNLAALTISRILSKMEQAGEFPFSGRIVPEYENPSLRELLWQDYRIVCRVETHRIVIVLVTHGSNQLPQSSQDAIP